MNRRSLLKLGGLFAVTLPALAFQEEKSKLMPPPGGPEEVYRRFEEDNHLSRGPEGIYARPSDAPGLGWDIEVV